MNSTETPNEQAPDWRNAPSRDQNLPRGNWRRDDWRQGRMRRRFHPLRVLGMIAMVILCFFLFGFAAEHLWNWLMPSIFHLRTITFVEAIGLVLLGKILFGGIHRGGRGRWRGRRGGPGSHRWEQHMKAKFDAMTPEEREKFRAGMRGGSWCRPERPTRPETTQGGL